MNKINLVIAYSQQQHNACKEGDVEQTHMYPIALNLYNIVRLDPRIKTYLIPIQNTDTDNHNLRGSIALSNKFIRANGGKGYHIELHSDAGGVQGATGLYKSETGKRLSLALLNELAELTPAADTNRVRQRLDLGALNQTDAIATIIEVSAHDRSDEAKDIHVNQIPFAVAIAHGWYRFLRGENLI